MLRAEINESGAVFINRYVLTAFLVEQDSIDTVEYALVETVGPVTTIYQQQYYFMGMPGSRGFCRTQIVNPAGGKHAGSPGRRAAGNLCQNFSSAESRAYMMLMAMVVE